MLSLYLSAGGSSTTLMGQIDEGIGFIGHYLEGQQEPHTGALQFAGHLVWDSETAGGTERRQTVPGPAFPARSCIVHLCTSPSADPVQSGRGRVHEGAARLGWEKSAVAMETAVREELGLCAGWGREGRLVSAWKQPRGLCTCTALCTRSHRKHGDRKCRTNSARREKKKKKSTMQINKVFNDNMSKVILFLTPRRGSNQIAAGGYIGASNRTSFWSKVSYSWDVAQTSIYRWQNWKPRHPLTLLLPAVLFLLPFGRPLGLFGVGDPLGSWSDGRNCSVIRL